MLERGPQAELTSHLGYEKGDPAAGMFENHRNGSSEKTVLPEAGSVLLSVPRDRQGTFTPRLVAKGQRRLGGLDEMIVSLYAGGMTIRDIQHHLATTIGTELSHETISKITDEIFGEVLTWQTRPLEALYPVIYLDALVVKVRDGAHVKNKAAHIAIGVDMLGVKHVLASGSKAARALSSGVAWAPNSATAASRTCSSSAAMGWSAYPRPSPPPGHWRRCKLRPYARVRRAPDSGRHALRGLPGPQARSGGLEADLHRRECRDGAGGAGGAGGQ